MITVGIVVGAGIFQTPALVAGIAGSAQLAIGAWALGGLLSLIGALTYAELATTFPAQAATTPSSRERTDER
jgi:amino acid transporter